MEVPQVPTPIGRRVAALGALAGAFAGSGGVTGAEDRRGNAPLDSTP